MHKLVFHLKFEGTSGYIVGIKPLREWSTLGSSLVSPV